MQYKLCSEFCKKIRRDSEFSFIDELPMATTERVRYLFDSGLSTLSSTETEDVVSAYSQALYWYHLSEESFVLNNQKLISVDRQDLKEITRIISDFSTKKTMLK